MTQKSVRAPNARKNRKPMSAAAKRRATQLRNQARFLEAFQLTSTLSAAAGKSNVARRTHYNWLHDDHAYALKFKTVNEKVTEDLEAEVYNRAMNGAEKPVFYKGDRVGIIREKSDVLLMFLLNARRPEVYRRRLDVNAKHGPTDEVTAEIIAGLSDEKLEELKLATDTMKAIIGGAG